MKARSSWLLESLSGGSDQVSLPMVGLYQVVMLVTASVIPLFFFGW